RKAARRPPDAMGSAGSLRAVATTSAPASRKRSVMPRPTPLVPPVTRTTRPDRSRAVSSGVVTRGAPGGDRARSANGVGTIGGMVGGAQSAIQSDDPSETGTGGRDDMGITHTIDADGVAEVVMDNPPVNALTVAGW